MKRKCSKIPFNRGAHVYVVGDMDGNVEWVSLYDLCRILERGDMYENGQAAGLCPAYGNFPVYGNGKLYRFVRLYDATVLIRAVRKEDEQVAILCDELEQWIVSLSTGHRLPSIGQAAAKPLAEPVTFTFRGHPVSFMKESGRIFLNATQMAKAVGRNHKKWLLMAETARFRQSLVEQGKSKGTEEQILTVRGSHGATWMEAVLGLEFARWLSPELHAWCREKLAALSRQNRVAIEKNDDYKIAFYNDFIENRECFKTSLIAEELRITASGLHRFLMEHKICRFENRQYVVYPAYAPLQCDHPYLWTNKYGKTYACSHGKRWTKAGREYILELYRAKNPYTGTAVLPA
ncbi:phage antirepressor KilAC domain-containing protein [Viscerimonas tarda]